MSKKDSYTLLFHNGLKSDKFASEYIKSEKLNIIEVEYGNKFKQVNKSKYLISISEEDHSLLFNALQSLPDTILQQGGRREF